MSRKLYDIAQEVVKASLRTRPKHWTSKEIAAVFELDDTQTEQVKKHAKKIAAELGVMWAWDPTIARFRVAPSGETAIGKAMVDYAYNQWAAAGTSINHLVDGAKGQGFVSERVRASTQLRNEVARDAIESAGRKIRFRKVTT